jgi:AcrR family transcriptional regulator
VVAQAARWAGQRERRRQEFVDAALRAIAEYGPEVSTERIAEEAGVARPQLYKHFADAVDLRHAVAERAVSWVNAELAPLWELRGSPMEMIHSAISSHMCWLSEHRNLYLYLSRYAGRDAVTDIRTAISQHLTRLLEHYFGIGTRLAEPAAYGVVGLVEATMLRWLDHPGGITRDALTELLGRWVWRIIDDVLRQGGVELDPAAALPATDLPFPAD